MRYPRLLFYVVNKTPVILEYHKIYPNEYAKVQKNRKLMLEMEPGKAVKVEDIPKRAHLDAIKTMRDARMSRVLHSIPVTQENEFAERKRVEALPNFSAWSL